MGSFGWTNINKHECVLAGGCWSGTKCQSPLKLNDITEEQLNNAIQHINFLKFVDKTASTTEAKSLSLKEMLAVQAMNAGNQNRPGFAGLFSGMDMNKLLKYKYLMGGNTAATLPGLATYAMMNNQAIDFNNVGQNNLSGLANLAYLTSQNDSGDLMQSMVNNWAAQSLGLDANTLWLIQGYDASTSPFTSSASDAGLGIPTASNDMFASSKLADYFKTQALLGGKMEFGAMFGNNQQSTCPAEEVSVNCMPPSSSSFTDFLLSTRRRLSAKPRAAVGINLAKTTTLLALPDTLAHGIQNGLSTTNSPSCHHSHNPSVAVAHFPHVSNKRAVPPNMISQPLQSLLSKLPQLSTTPLQLLSQSSPPQSTTPNTANGKRPLAPSHAVVVSSPNTVTASLAVIHSATNVNSNTTTHATNMLASMVFHWVHLAKSLVVNK